LFDTQDNLSAHGGSVEVGTSYIDKIILKTHGADVMNPQFDSQSDLEDVFKDGWTGYNHYFPAYADMVLMKTFFWLPTLGRDIFTKSGGN
jgi:hypothetical protein